MNIMNQGIINEIVLGLRRLDTFPEVTVAAIDQIIKAYAHYQRRGGGIQWNPEMMAGLVLEFVFRIHQAIPLNIKRTKLLTIERLEVAHILMTNLSTIEFDNDRQLLFDTFFPFPFVSTADGNVPHTILSLMTSLSVATRDKRVLKTIGDWMHVVGVDSPAVLCIARDVATDMRTDEDSDKYSHLPASAPKFASILLYAIAKSHNTNTAPPKRLFNHVVQWVESVSSICFIPPHYSSIFDLFRWVINSKDDESRLHLALLKAISENELQLQVIPQILTLILEIRQKFDGEKSNSIPSSKSSSSAITRGDSGYEATTKATDRLLQLIQILIGSKYLDWNEIHPIFEAFEHSNLPPTRLYEIMKSNYVKG